MQNVDEDTLSKTFHTSRQQPLLIISVNKTLIIIVSIILFNPNWLFKLDLKPQINHHAGIYIYTLSSRNSNSNMIRNCTISTFCPYQPPSQRLRVKVVVGMSEDRLLFGVVALAEPVWPPKVWNTGLSTTTWPERGPHRGVRQGTEQGIMGYTESMTSRVLPRVILGVL